MKILRQREVVQLTGLSKVTLWRLEQKGEFPQKIALSPNRVGWLESEILNWVNSRPRLGEHEEAWSGLSMKNSKFN